MSDPVLFFNSTLTYVTSVSTDEEVLVNHKGSLLSQFVLRCTIKKNIEKVSPLTVFFKQISILGEGLSCFLLKKFVFSTSFMIQFTVLVADIEASEGFSRNECLGGRKAL